MALPENALSYHTSRDGPAARHISRTLTGLVEWIDDTYEAPEQIVYRRKRCRTRMVSTRYSDGGLAYRDVDLSVHGAYGSCHTPRHHSQGAGLTAFRVEDNAFWKKTAIEGSITTVSGGVLFATTLLENETYTEDELGLEVDGIVRWTRTFADPEEVAEHMEIVRKLCVGAFTMRETAELLIGQPAGILDTAMLEAFAPE